MMRIKSIILAYIAVFSSLSIILAITRAEVPFLPLSYLKFDFAEVPVMIVFMLGGPIPALFTEVIHWLGLTFRSGWLGPLMKFLAVVPMIIGFWIGTKVGVKTPQRRGGIGSTRIFILGMIFGIIMRVVVCSFTNTLLFLFISPNYLLYAEALLRATGISVNSSFDVLIWTLIFTGIFNAIHVPLSSITSLIILRAALRKIPSAARNVWFLQL